MKHFRCGWRTYGFGHALGVSFSRAPFWIPFGNVHVDHSSNRLYLSCLFECWSGRSCLFLRKKWEVVRMLVHSCVHGNHARTWSLHRLSPNPYCFLQIETQCAQRNWEAIEGERKPYHSRTMDLLDEQVQWTPSQGRWRSPMGLLSLEWNRVELGSEVELRLNFFLVVRRLEPFLNFCGSWSLIKKSSNDGYQFDSEVEDYVRTSFLVCLVPAVGHISGRFPGLGQVRWWWVIHLRIQQFSNIHFPSGKIRTAFELRYAATDIISFTFFRHGASRYYHVREFYSCDLSMQNSRVYFILKVLSLLSFSIAGLHPVVLHISYREAPWLR